MDGQWALFTRGRGILPSGKGQIFYDGTVVCSLQISYLYHDQE
jgi:hypothetical protein